MVCHDLIQYRFSYQRHDICWYLKKLYDSIQEYIDRYIDIIILYTYFKQPSTFLLHEHKSKNATMGSVLTIFSTDNQITSNSRK